MQKANVNETRTPVTFSDVAKACSLPLSIAQAAYHNPYDLRHKQVCAAASALGYVPGRKAKSYNPAALEAIPVPEKPVQTLQELAQLIHMPYGTLCRVLNGGGAPGTQEYVRRAVERFGYKPWKPGRVTARDIATRTGFSVVSVQKALGSAPTTLSPATVQQIRDVAAEMGYDATPYHPKGYLHRSNFPSPEVELERMEILRSQGYSNADIARKTGTSYQRVLYRLGKQPKAITKMNCAASAIGRHLRSIQRERYQLQPKLEEYSAAQAQLEQLQAEETALRAKVVQLRRYVRRAEKLDAKLAAK